MPGHTTVDAELRGLLDRGSRRIAVAGFIERLVVTSTVVFAAIALVIIVSRLTPWIAPVGAMLGLGLLLAFIGAAAWSLITMPRGVALADEVDRRAGLREALSTSVVFATQPGDVDAAWSHAVTQNARDRARRVVLRDAIPLLTPDTSARAPIVAASAMVLALLFMPRYDLTGILAAEAQRENDTREAQQVQLEIKAEEKKLEEILSRAGIEPLAGEEESDDPQSDDRAPQKPDEIRRERMRKLTRLTDQLDEATTGEKSKGLEALRQSMGKLKAPAPGPLQEFQRQLGRGNFAEAERQFERLAEQLQSDALSDDQREQLADQLYALSEQLDELAQNQEQLEQALREAGLSEEQAAQAARDPSALERMLSEMPGIEAPQLDALRQIARAQSQASESMQSMAAGAEQMAQNAEQGQQSGEGQQGSPQQGDAGASQMSSALGDAAQMASEQSAASQALAEARSQLASLGDSMAEGGAGMNPGTNQGTGRFGPTGQWAEGASNQLGEGSGGPGQGNGDAPDAIATDFMLKEERAEVTTQGGPIIASTVVYGEQIRGESRASFSTAVEAASAQSAEAIETMRIPREYHDAVRAYFGRLERAAREQAAQGQAERGQAERDGSESGE